MPQCRFISLKESIASYMLGMNTNKMSLKEVYDWSTYLERTLSNQDCKTLVSYGKEAMKQLQREKTQIFEFGYDSISLAENKNKGVLSDILSLVRTDTLIDIDNALDRYRAKGKDKFDDEDDRVFF